MPLVSVVMSVYNDEERVGRSIDSILQQTFQDFEFIIINDGSTDGTAQVLDRYADQDSRIRVIHQENTGLTQALIRGCQQAQGQLIARQDADDWSHPDRLQQQIDHIQRYSEIGFVSCAVQYVGPQGEPLIVISREKDSQQATQALIHDRQGPPAHGSVLFRKSVYHQVGGYRPQFYYAQDSDLWLRMAEVSKVSFLQEILYTHLRDISSTSGVNRPLQKRFGELGQCCKAARLQGQTEKPYLEEAEALANSAKLRTPSAPSSRQKALGAATYFIASFLVDQGDRRALGYLHQTLIYNPFHVRAWIRLFQSLYFRMIGSLVK